MSTHKWVEKLDFYNWNWNWMLRVWMRRERAFNVGACTRLEVRCAGDGDYSPSVVYFPSPVLTRSAGRTGLGCVSTHRLKRSDVQSNVAIEPGQTG